MKLLMVLTLAALPLCCSAGSGCQLLEDVIYNVINSGVSTAQLKQSIQQFIPDNATANAVDEFKQCFLQQSNDTLSNIQNLMERIYGSFWCKAY
ncbi:mammaglobin-A-like [Cynocephalus volans]|uniref:mammaglobin-A-like n=1 Tax=Cynocephalus volans TaxID=110931 RepID=UPI002FC724C5